MPSNEAYREHRVRISILSIRYGYKYLCLNQFGSSLRASRLMEDKEDGYCIVLARNTAPTISTLKHLQFLYMFPQAISGGNDVIYQYRFLAYNIRIDYNI